MRSKAHFVGLGIAMLAAAATAFVSNRESAVYADLSAEANHSRTVIDETHDLISLLREAQSAERGYLLTGEIDHLRAYREALDPIRSCLRALTLDREELVLSHVGRTLPDQVNRQLDELSETIALRERGDTVGALAIARAATDTATMDAIQATGRRLIQAEQREYSTRESNAHHHFLLSRVAVIVGACLLLALVVGAAINVHRLVTDLEQSRQRASEHSEMLQTTLRSIGDAVVVTDQDSNVTFMNPVAEQLTGWYLDEAMGRPTKKILRIVAGLANEQAEDPVGHVLQSGTIVGLSQHAILRTRAGKDVLIDDSGAPIRGPDGKTMGVVLVFRDVTSRQQAQSDLEESERRYRLLFESNPQPMWVYDQKTLAFLAVNNAALERYGYSRQEFLAMTLCDIRPAEDVPKLLGVTAVPPSALNIEGPWRHRKKDGSVILVEIAEHPLVFDGRDACLVMPTDITEREFLQDQLLQRQRLESVGRLAGGVAHDFNNLLTVINGYSEMLLSDRVEGDAARENIEEILRAGNRAKELTRHLLAFARKQVIQPTVLSMNTVAGDMRVMLQRLIGEDIEVITRLAPDLGNVTADHGHLQQVIMNLVVNARDAMPQGGKLVIETENADFDDGYVATHPTTHPGRYVMLAVSDTGQGMADEVKAHLFEPFFTTKATGVGTGLGLSTVYGVVKQAGGWIWVYSEVGRGTTFKVYLPRTDMMLSPEQLVAPIERHGSETILVIEDQEQVRMLALVGLKSYGYDVHGASCGSEAVAFCKEFPGKIDLVVTDVVMTDMNGRDVAREIERIRPGTQILFVSGYTSDVIGHHGVLDQGVAYLPKPFTRDLLAAKIREILGEAR